MLKNIVSVSKTFISKYIIYGLGAVALISSAGWYVTDLKLDTAKSNIESCKANREADQSKWKAVASEAQVRNLLEVKKIEDENNRIAKEADVRLNDLRKQFNANLLQYVRNQAAVAASGTVRIPDGGSPGSSDSPSEATLVSISYEDAGICAENTARIQAVKEWADSQKQ